MVNNENIFKFSLKEKILKHLIENKDARTSIKQISERLNTDYKNTFKSINSMQDIISKEKVGNINLIKIKLTPNPETHSLEHKRTKEFLEKNRALRLIKEDAQSLDYPFLIVLIFGSIAKGTSNKKSDIDLCIISDNKDKTHELISKLKLLSLNLEIHDFTIQEFDSMLKTRKNNLAHEIIKNNIIIYGIENYYNLVSEE